MAGPDTAAPLSVATLRAIVQQASDAIFVSDKALCIEWVNERTCDLLGLPFEQLVGRRITEFLDPGDLAREPISADIVAGRMTKARRTIRAAHGATRVLEVSATAVDDGRLLGIARDTTERLVAQDRLQRSEASFRALIESSTDGVVVHRDGRIVYINPAGARMLGATSADGFVGTRVLDLMHPDDRKKAADRIGAIVRGESLVPFADERLLRRDGTVITASVSAMPVLFEGEPSIVAVARDVTIERRLQEQLAQADRLASLGTLAAGVAHEINNPLAYVLLRLEGIVSLAQSAEIDKRALVDHATAAVEGAQRVARIVRDLRALSRFEADQRAPTDVRRAAEVAVRTASHELKHRARVVLSLGDVPPVLATEGRLTQVFLNLLLNAAHSIPEGRPEDNEIRVSTTFDDGAVRVAISDTGAGIPAEDLGRIFEPFFTTTPVGEGSGLGLAICHGLVAALDGRILVQSKQGEGSTFTVVLPPAPESSMPRPPSDRAARPTLASPARILIVDDEAAICQSLAVALEGRHDVVTARSALAARQILERDDAFDAIVCDVVMPEVNGAELYRWISEAKPRLARRVVFMSGGREGEARRAVASIESWRFLQKPFDLADLEALVAEALRRAPT